MNKKIKKRAAKHKGDVRNGYYHASNWLKKHNASKKAETVLR